MGFVRLFCLVLALVSSIAGCTVQLKKNYGWRRVINKHAVNINFEENDLEVKTNSGPRFGSNHKIRMVFLSREGKEAGGVFIKFSNPLQYMIGWCSEWKTFPPQLPSEVDKIWKFSKDKETVVVTCNDIEVINFIASDESCDRWPNWRYYWEKEPNRVKFTKHLDRASDEYRIKEPDSDWIRIPKGIKFELDLQRTPLEISTTSEFGSRDEINVVFFDRDGNTAGGLKVKFLRRPKFAAQYCSRLTDLPWRKVKRLREMPLEKVWTFQRSDAGVRVLVNGEEVLDFTVSSATCKHWTSWRRYWSLPVTTVQFGPSHNTASKACRVQGSVSTEAPRQKRVTISPPKGHNWYGTRPPPTELPTKHSVKRDNCWMKGVRPRNSEVILTAAWQGEEHCKNLCLETLGCHAAYKQHSYRWGSAVCELFGKYDVYQPTGLYYRGKGSQLLAERKCFDPEHYRSVNSTSPCGNYSWECNERCIMISWRCDGERDCEGGEDENECDIHVYPGPFCGPGQWKCTEFHLCPNNINWWEDRTCVQCISEKYLCNGYPNCYSGEDESPEVCPEEEEEEEDSSR